MTNYNLIRPLPCAILLFVFVLAQVSLIKACTTFAMGKLATVDGSVLATHTNDGSGTTDPRLVKIPAQDFEEGSKRAVYYPPEDYPRYVGYSRKAYEYYPENCESTEDACKEFEPIGYIPQVKHTYAYLEQTYGALNEKQVGIVESTCSGVFASKAAGHGGKALLSIDSLSQIAMERASTAREAVMIMGNLSQTYGFYGESASFEGGAESLFVTDPNEAWAFHILADPTGTSSIWVAARIPDDSVAVVANMFSVRVVDLQNTQNFLGRADMWELAEKQGLYKPGDVKDFTATFSDGEYAHKYYSGRRMWGVFRLLSPSSNLPSEYGNLKNDKPYPFAVPVSSKVSLSDVKKVLRDWYGGTNYSTGSPDQVLAGGAFSSPDRYSTSSANGNWERTIALYRSSDTYIVQSRAWLSDAVGGVLWFGPHASTATVYVPILVTMNKSPDCLAHGWQGIYNLSTSFWAHRIVENIAQIKFSYMIKDIEHLQNALETQSELLVDSIAQLYGSKLKSTLNSIELSEITTLLSKNANYARMLSLELAHKLLFKYADGNLNVWTNNKFSSYGLGYEQWWLDLVGYANGPPDVNKDSNGYGSMFSFNKVHSAKVNAIDIGSTGTDNLKVYPASIISGEYRGHSSLRECIHLSCEMLEDTFYDRCVFGCMNKQ